MFVHLYHLTSPHVPLCEYTRHTVGIVSLALEREESKLVLTLVQEGILSACGSEALVPL